jgi:putative component of toxin-antitoxin plasmid stabilization module
MWILTVLEYLDRAGSSPFAAWFRVLDATIVILLAGGTKKRQDRDIADAHERWADYKKRKAQEK